MGRPRGQNFPFFNGRLVDDPKPHIVSHPTPPFLSHPYTNQGGKNPQDLDIGALSKKPPSGLQKFWKNRGPQNPQTVFQGEGADSETPKKTPVFFMPGERENYKGFFKFSMISPSHSRCRRPTPFLKDCWGDDLFLTSPAFPINALCPIPIQTNLLNRGPLILRLFKKPGPPGALWGNFKNFQKILGAQIFPKIFG